MALQLINPGVIYKKNHMLRIVFFFLCPPHIVILEYGNVLIYVKKQSQELTRVNPDRNIFSINVELTSTFLLYRGLVHHHQRILNKGTFH